jgi:hypothetical protein
MNKVDWTKELYYIISNKEFVRYVEEIEKSSTAHNNYNTESYKKTKGKNYYGKKRRYYADYS